jgi:hypothetical protein
MMARLPRAMNIVEAKNDIIILFTISCKSIKTRRMLNVLLDRAI